jgi:predicted dehydrogenase
MRYYGMKRTRIQAGRAKCRGDYVMTASTNRRGFLKTAAVGATAATMSALSYGRVHGANDRIRIGMIGCGKRGIDAHMRGVNPHAKDENVEIVAVADPWRPQREEAAALCKEWYGIEAKQFVTYRDLLALDDVDAVMIASPDHVHTTHLKAAAEATKDIYIEKPIGMDLERVKQACDAVKASKVIAQVGTQLRSMASMAGAREVFQSGVLGNISRIEQCRNGWRPYWYGFLREVREEDVDWQEFLADRPMRPFDPHQYSAWYGYRDFSDGAVPNLGCHFIDLMHYITGAQYPASSVCQGGTFVWQDDYHFTCDDHVQATWIYPEGFMVSYSSNFGNNSGNSFKIFGENGVLDLVNWDKPMLTAGGTGEKKAAVDEPQRVEHISRPDHMLNWLQCLRTRETPHAPIEAGYQHSVAVIMATMAMDQGRRMVYEHEKREIRQG